MRLIAFTSFRSRKRVMLVSVPILALARGNLHFLLLFDALRWHCSMREQRSWRELIVLTTDRVDCDATLGMDENAFLVAFISNLVILEGL